MIGWIYTIVFSLMAPLYATLITVHLNVFVVDARLILKNRTVLRAIFNPFALLMKRRIKLSIMSEELSFIENSIYHKRSVIIEKSLKDYAFKKCLKCGEVPNLGLVEWVMKNSVCVKCKCGTHYLENKDGKMFTWPFSSSIFGSSHDTKTKRGQKILDRAVKSLTTDWNKLPDMPKRDRTKQMFIEKLIKELDLL